MTVMINQNTHPVRSSRPPNNLSTRIILRATNAQCFVLVYCSVSLGLPPVAIGSTREKWNTEESEGGTGILRL